MMHEVNMCVKFDEMSVFIPTLLEPSADGGMVKGTEIVAPSFSMEEVVQ